MPLPGDFSLSTYVSLAKKIGLPSVPAFGIPSLVVISPKALQKITPKLPDVSLPKVKGNVLINRISPSDASGFAAALDASDNSALLGVTPVNPITGS